MTVEDSTVRIIGSDTERLENGEGRRSESEEESMINKETITVEDEGMDKGGWAWVVVLGEPLFFFKIHNVVFTGRRCSKCDNGHGDIDFCDLSLSIFSFLQPPSSATW